MHIYKPSRMNIPLRNLLRVRKKMASSEEINYKDEDLEIVLCYCMHELKPVGVNRYFIMMSAHQRLSQNLKMEVSSKIIWDYLDTLYDMGALHDCEVIPFPNDEVDFELPEDFEDILKEKFGVSMHKDKAQDDDESSKNDSNGKSGKKPSVSKLKQSTPNDAKNTFLTPTAKPAKSNTDTKPPSNESSSKKQDTPLASKIGKVKRSSSPFTSRSVKAEASAKEENNETASKKSAKGDQIVSNSRKSIKSENSSTPINSKKTSKQETSSVKQVKSENSDSSSKRNKSEREPLKKGRHSSASENSVKKPGKPDNKKVEVESSKRLSDTSSKLKVDKHSNSTSKTSKADDESHYQSGTRKHSLGKVDTNDKKRKRQKTDDSAKRSVPAVNRRRT